MTTLVTLLGIGLYFYWIFTPRLKDSELVRQILESAETRREEEQRHANDPEANGYLNPTFLPYWGVFTDRVEGSRAEVVTEAWAAYCKTHDQNPKDHEALQQDPDYLKAHAEFEELLPELIDATRKSDFVVPRPFSVLCADQMQFGKTIYILSAIIARAEFHLARKESREAFTSLLLALQFALLLRSSNETVQRSIGGAFSQRTMSAFVGLISTSHEDVENWECLATLCLPRSSLEDHLVKVFGEHLAGSNFRLRNAPVSFEGVTRPATPQNLGQMFFTVLFKALRVNQREKRISSNGICHLIQQIRAHQALEPEIHRYSLFGGLAVPTGQYLENFVSQAHNSQAALLGLGVSAALLSHRLTKGQFPTILAELPYPIDESLFQWNPESGKLMIPNHPSLPKKSWKSETESAYTPEPWIHKGPQGWCFHLT